MHMFTTAVTAATLLTLLACQSAPPSEDPSSMPDTQAPALTISQDLVKRLSIPETSLNSGGYALSCTADDGGAVTCRSLKAGGALPPALASAVVKELGMKALTASADRTALLHIWEDLSTGRVTQVTLDREGMARVELVVQ